MGRKKQLSTDSLDKAKQLSEDYNAQYYLLLEQAYLSDNPVLQNRAVDEMDRMLGLQKSNNRFLPSSNGNNLYLFDGNGGQKSYIFDPNHTNNGMGYRNKNAPVTYNLLYLLSHMFPVRSIIETRIEQVASFCEPQKDIYSTGFVIRPKRGDMKKLTSDQKRTIDFLTRFILECGVDKYYYDGDDFDSFIRKFVRDTLTYDQATFEIVWNKYGFGHRKGAPVYFIATDASLFRYADNMSLYDRENTTVPSYVMLYNGTVHQDFYSPELCFAVRNPSSNIYRNGYGRSEIEDLVSEITSFSASIEYNMNYFRQGSMPKGFFTMEGEVTDARLEDFRRMWQAMTQGVRNAHRTPILGGKGINWVDFQKSNQDMEFVKWLETLLKIICAGYKIDPSEIGFPLNGSANDNPLIQNGTEARLKYSKDKGLYPLLKFVQNNINKYLINPLNPDYEFCFVGLDGVTREMELQQDKLQIENLTKEVSSYKTLNEAREERGLPPIKGGDIPVNPTFISAMSQAQPQKNDNPSTQEEDNPIKAYAMQGAKALEELIKYGDKNNDNAFYQRQY